MMHEPKSSLKPLGVVWIDCPDSLVSMGLVRVLQEKAQIHQGSKPPGDVPSCIILCTNSQDGLSERVEFYRELSQDAPPVVVFGPQLDLPLARDALQAGASGFVHAEMTPDQLLRAVSVARLRLNASVSVLANIDCIWPTIIWSIAGSTLSMPMSLSALAISGST